MENQKSIIVLHQKKEKEYAKPADELRNTEDIGKGVVRRSVKKLATGESIIGKGSKVRGERSIDNGEDSKEDTHPVTRDLFTQEVLQSEFDYYMAQKLLKKLREADLISEGELDKITAKNRQSFSPYLARIMP